MAAEDEKSSKTSEAKKMKTTSLKQKVADLKAKSESPCVNDQHMVDLSQERGAAKHEELLALQATLESAFQGLGRPISGEESSRGATLSTSTQPGHLLHQCLDDCLFKAKLADITEVSFPGAFANETVGTVWKAWVACSIFCRKDMDVAKKIKFYRQGVICLNEDVLRIVLKFAYDKCTEWTEFLCETDTIKKHAPVEDYCVEGMYNNALKALKKELNEQSKGKRPIKDGPTIYAAPECGAVMEADGMRGGIQTVLTNTFNSLRQKVKEWHAFATWVIVWPIDTHWEKNAITEIAAACTKHFEEGGKVVSEWTPGSHENIHKWKDTYQIWSLLDEKLEKEAGKDQFFKTSTTKLIEGKIYAEFGSPETCWQFYSKYAGAANARSLYGNIRMSAQAAKLPALHAPPRTSASRRGGMSGWEETPMIKRSRRA